MLWRWTGDMHCRLVWFSCCWNKSDGTNHNTKIQCSCKDVIHLVKSSLQTMVDIDTWFKDLKSEIRCQNIELLAINCVQSLASRLRLGCTGHFSATDRAYCLACTHLVWHEHRSTILTRQTYNRFENHN